MKVEMIPVTMTLHKDLSAGGHRDPYFLFTGDINLTPKGKGFVAHIKGIASLPSGESTPIEMNGPLSSRGTWITIHSWGWLGFQPINLASCPYPPIWGWHECPEKLKVSQYLLDAGIWKLPTQERLDHCRVGGKIG